LASAEFSAPCRSFGVTSSSQSHREKANSPDAEQQILLNLSLCMAFRVDQVRGMIYAIKQVQGDANVKGAEYMSWSLVFISCVMPAVLLFALVAAEQLRRKSGRTVHVERIHFRAVERFVRRTEQGTAKTVEETHRRNPWER
jgi:hypothetical protein